MATEVKLDPYARHWRLARGALAHLAGGSTRAHRDWTIEIGPDLPCLELRLPDNAGCIWLLGHPWVPDGTVAAFIEELPRPASREQWLIRLDQLRGSWCAIVVTDRESFVMLDAAGSLPAFFDPGARALASCVALIATQPALEAADDTLGQRRRSSESYLPFGLTAWPTVAHLLPDHALDLESFHPFRHWPFRWPSPTSDLDATVDEIVSELRLAMAVACRDGRPLMGLTGGRDSRVLLACARDLVGNIDFFTWAHADDGARRDLADAAALAELAGVRHRDQAVIAPDAAFDEYWALSTSGALSDRRAKAAAASSVSLGSQRAMILGTGAEVGRAYYWQSGDQHLPHLELDDLIERLGVPATAVVAEAGQQWLSSLPVVDVEAALDLAYIEQRLGCWASAWASGSGVGPRYLFPYVGRRLFELYLALPAEFRRQDALAAEIIRRTWPDLLRLPFNRPASWRRRVSAALARTPVLWRFARRL
ncbi:MAG TPA: hypothetical protein PLN55_10775 [Burkholderiaceae bacterium]|nr:hypothetical protein [Burkholderiaceae bacterium]HRY90574.1 hypothetical protein [Rubrivivax sp.]